MTSNDLSSRQSAEICFWALAFILLLFCPAVQDILYIGMSNTWLRLVVTALVFIAFLYCICGLVLQRYYPNRVTPTVLHA